MGYNYAISCLHVTCVKFTHQISLLLTFQIETIGNALCLAWPVQHQVSVMRGVGENWFRVTLCCHGVNTQLQDD